MKNVKLHLLRVAVRQGKIKTISEFNDAYYTACIAVIDRRSSRARRHGVKMSFR